MADAQRDEWPEPKIAYAFEQLERTLGHISELVQALNDKVDRFDDRYIRKTEADILHRQIDERHTELAKWVTDLAASLERTNRESGERWKEHERAHTERSRSLVREWIAPVITTVIGAVIIALFLSHAGQ